MAVRLCAFMFGGVGVDSDRRSHGPIGLRLADTERSAGDALLRLDKSHRGVSLISQQLMRMSTTTIEGGRTSNTTHTHHTLTQDTRTRQNSLYRIHIGCVHEELRLLQHGFKRAKFNSNSYCPNPAFSISRYG